MVLESTMICFDNSEHMRNGDFAPTRLQCQQDATNLLIQCKLRSNPENCVGLLSMAGRVNVLATLTTDSNKLFLKLHSVQPTGESQFLTALKIAHLALKHRQNRNHKPRIILFVGSQVDDEEAELIKTAKKFKKEKVNVDIVCFGDLAGKNHEKLKQFLETLSGKDGTGSHIISVPPGSDLQQALLTSPIVRNEDGTAPVVAAQGQGFFDPNEDPELALALRVSLEEQRQRQEQEAATAAAAGATQPQPGGGPPPNVQRNFDELSEDEQIALALQMSLEQSHPQHADDRSVDVEPMDTTTQQPAATANVPPSDEASVSAAPDDIGELMSDPNALQALVSSLPGVDPNSEAVQQALAQAAAEGKGKTTPKKPAPGKDKEKKDEKK